MKFVEALEAKGVWSRDEAELRAKLEEAGVDTERDRSWSQLVDHAYSHFVEPELIQPTIVYDWPIELSPFARTTDEDETLVERFEAVVGGMEFANAFSELNDAEEQAQRFAMQEAEREAGAEESEPGDPDYVEALSYGMPPTGGCGIGIDRLTMVLTGSDAIRDVILFPGAAVSLVEPEQRYALDALLDALGLPFDEAVPAGPEVLDEVFGLLTLAQERDAELDQHGRPLPPAEPPGPRVAELARRARARAARLSGRRAVPGRAHARRRPARRGRRCRPRRASWRRRSRTARGGGCARAMPSRLDAVRGRDPDYPLEEMLAAEGARGSTCFFLTRQEDPQDGYPERYRPALRERARANARRPGSRSGCTPPTARERGRRDRRGGAAARRRSRACATTTCAATRPGWRRSCAGRACATTRASAGPRCRGCARARRIRTGSGTPERREPGAWELPLVVMDATLAEERYLGLGADEGVRGRGRCAGAGRRARRRGRDPLAPAVAPPATLERLRPTSTGGCSHWIDERGGWAGTRGRDARPLGGQAELAEERDGEPRERSSTSRP